MARAVRITACGEECSFYSKDGDCNYEERTILIEDIDESNFPIWCPLEEID